MSSEPPPAPSERRAPARELVERRDRGGELRRMLRVRLRDERPQADRPVRMAMREPDEQVAVELVVRVPDVVEAGLLGLRASSPSRSSVSACQRPTPNVQASPRRV